MEVLRRTDLLAHALFSFAFASPCGPVLSRRPRRGTLRTRRWPRQLDEALTLCSLLDLANLARLERDEAGALIVRDRRPTGAPPHDLLLERIAEASVPRTAGVWVWVARREVAGALLRHAIVAGDLRPVCGGHGHRGTPYAVGDLEGVEELRAAVGRVLAGAPDDPPAAALVLICLASSLWQFLPSSGRDHPDFGVLGPADRQRFHPPASARTRQQRRLVAFWEHVEREPGPIVRAALGPGAAAIGLGTLSDLAHAVPKAGWVATSGWSPS